MSTQDIIQSAHNPKIQLVRSLMNQNKARKKQQAFVAEGVRLIEDGLDSSIPLKFMLRKADPSPRAVELLESLGENQEILTVEEHLFDELSDTGHSQGVLGVFEQKALSLPENPNFLVILDQIRDPGNLGTILRSAEAAGAQAVILPPGNTDAFAPKVVRAGMGAHFRLSILQLPWEVVKHLVEGLPVFHADMNGALTYWEADFDQALVLLIGGEAEGISEEGQKILTHSVRIPMKGKTESLNAAISASILMIEVLRQRSQV